MMNMIKSAFVFTIVVFLLGYRSFAQSETPLEYWKVTVSTSTLTDIAKRMSDPCVPRWPVVASSFAVGQLPNGKEKQDALSGIQLVEALQEKFKGQFNRNANLSLPQLEADVSLYSSIANGLNRAGGYSNRVLADSALRLAIFRVSGWVAFHPEDTPASKKLVSLLNVPSINLKASLGELAGQDSLLISHKADIQKISDGDSLFKALVSKMGISMDVLLNPQAMVMSELLSAPSSIGLVFRMATTEALVKTNLDGAIRFFELGGTYAELNPKDIRPFVSRMGKEARAYSFPLLQIRQLNETHVLYLIGLHKDEAVGTAWLDSALK